MDEWLFISLAKVKADAPEFRPSELGPAALQPEQPVTKADTALALDYEVLEEKPRFRGAVALAAAALVTGTFLGTIEGTALKARTPAGEVIVAELEQPQPAFARADTARNAQAPL